MGNAMTVFLKQHCACWVENMCLGVDAQRHTFNNSGKCLIMDRKVCRYFRAGVLPIAKEKDLYDKIAKLYSKIDKSFVLVITHKCKCGAEIQKRMRFCDKCRHKNRIDTYRKCRRQLKPVSHEIKQIMGGK